MLGTDNFQKKIYNKDNTMKILFLTSQIHKKKKTQHKSDDAFFYPWHETEIQGPLHFL